MKSKPHKLLAGVDISGEISELVERKHSRRQFLTASGMGLSALTLEGTCAAEQARYIGRPQKKLIGWGTDVAYPSKVQMNIRKIEQLPLDGIILSNFSGTKEGKAFTFDWECFGREKYNREHLGEMIHILKHTNFERFTDNFLRFNLQPGDIDWFDDFSAPLHNARFWAEVAHEVGVIGWKFDLEDYKEKTFIYRKQKYADRKSFDEYSDQIRLRGRQMMQSIEAGYPNIVLLLSLAHSYVNRTPQANQKLSELSYGLLPAFVNGLIEAAGPNVRIIDGQEQAYGYLTDEDYYRGYHDIQQRALELVPRELWSKYRDKMEAAVSVYANYQLSVPRTISRYWVPHYMSADQRLRLFEQNIYNALNTTDEYVWLYSEHMGWWESGYQLKTPAGSIEAIHSARKKAARGKPLGFDLSDVIEESQTKMKLALERESSSR